MAESHLKDILTKLTAPKEIKTLISGIFNKLLHKTLSVVKERYLDQARLKKIQTKKKKAALDNSPSSKAMPISQYREEAYQEFKQREEETKEFVKKLKKDQKEREYRQREREEEDKRKLREEARENERAQQEAQMRIEEEKVRRLKQLKEKSSKRKQEIQGLIELGNQEYRKVISSKPLHEKIEEKYFSSVLMPELERHKMELAKKREMFQPINRSAILEHARRHDQIIEEHDVQKRNISQENNYDASKLRSKFTQAYLEEEKKRKHEFERETLEKKSLLEKKKQYAELVLEMYQPTIDPAKQLELKLMNEKMKVSSAKIKRKRSAKSLSAKDIISDNENPSAAYQNNPTAVKKRKWKKNPLVPEPPKKKEPIKVDWLAEKREEKKNQASEGHLNDIEWNDEMHSNKMKNKIKQLEKEVRKQEIKLEVANPSNIQGIKATENVSNMLINSIKGKLAILEKS
ncbi:hypothetical protein SteCoe_14428 [Stentor coeruleus]|uniref:Uncharacterized protein n=1 Tax=Stentor coeruleus TaxID=5963 RepID=A0A1R2C628_9CILI|nr:hypothetical protein SteCoe_14428 [Stentor coeruleus]